jgi:hypothetical protein
LVPLAVPFLVAGAVAALVSPRFLLVPALVVALLAVFAAAVARSVEVPRDEPKPRRLRALVAFLHIAQPLARTWGRLHTRPHRKARPRPRWTGDRAGWLRSLEREMRAAGCTVRVGGHHDRWDLEARAGPLLRGRITTGVAWNWALHLRIQHRLAPAAVLVLPVMALLALNARGATLPVLLLIAAELVHEHRRLRRALALARPAG